MGHTGLFQELCASQYKQKHLCNQETTKHWSKRGNWRQITRAFTDPCKDLVFLSELGTHCRALSRIMLYYDTLVAVLKNRIKESNDRSRKIFVWATLVIQTLDNTCLDLQFICLSQKRHTESSPKAPPRKFQTSTSTL